MSWLAIWLIAVGVMDVVRMALPRRFTWDVPLVGSLALLALALLTDLTQVADVVALSLALGPLVGWWWFSGRGLAPARRREHVLALTALAGGAAALVAFGGYASTAGGWFATWLAWAQPALVGGHDPQRVLLVTGLLVVNLATGNVIVRLVLVAVGAIRPGALGPQPADRLRGGRLLGPLERELIVGLGLAGQLTAASIVIAAKGLLRFPELQSTSRDGTSGINGVGIDEVTEYFLVGSFVSWILALGSLALTR